MSTCYKNNRLFIENVSLETIAKAVSTPCYVYSRQALEKNWHAFNDPFKSYPHQINYAVKATSNIAILNILAKLGSGFDIVSQGELERVLAAKGDPSKIVFSGVGKTRPELTRALEVGVGCINVESESELIELNDIAKSLDLCAPFALRVNPDVDALSHPYISTGLKENKFGVDLVSAKMLYQKAKNLKHLKIQGIGCHIGSQIISLAPFLNALEKMLILIDELRAMDISIQHLNMGGGLGVRYREETPPEPHFYVNALLEKIQEHRDNNSKNKLIVHLEPGRAIAANAGLLLTSVLHLKCPAPPATSLDEKNFAIVDAGMNDLLRPALYHAWQDIIPVIQRTEGNSQYYDIVGPVCESADFLGKERLLNIKQKDLLAICSSGAYGFSMSSNYNSRPRAAEVMVDKEKFHIIRQRETYTDLFRLEQIV